MTEQLERHGLTFEVRRSDRRKTVGITVDRDGSLLLHAPIGADDDDLAGAVRDKEVWVYTKLAEKEELLGLGGRRSTSPARASRTLVADTVSV